MARRQDQLIESIRSRRRQLGQNLRDLVALEPVRGAIRQRPLTWIVGGSVSGFVASRLLLRPGRQRRQSRDRGWIRGSLRRVFLDLVLLGMRERLRHGDGLAPAPGRAAQSKPAVPAPGEDLAPPPA